ncbi:MAG: diguanylate cyclase [Burkholderia sp.]|nr:diguanylate cyclase [Burkholderia sp.]
MNPEASVYQTLLESTAAIPWKIDWKSMQFAYIGPQIEPLLGWPTNSWATVDDWASRIHADDRERVVSYCVAQSSQGCDHEADYRALCRDGSYVWIRDVVHVVRTDGGEVEALVGFMFDITQRKQAEEQLAALNRELEALSYQDGLTGVANRRMFDLVCAREWANAQRSGLPLSLVMFDIDFFKQYNDRYGHLAGDDCLRRVAQLLDGANKRPRDFFARYGGEEFILLLPETDEAAASQVAERCRLIVVNDRIAHPVDTGSAVLTVSLGVGTVSPAARDECHAFIHLVDQCLYRAKIQGRNCVIGPTED